MFEEEKEVMVVGKEERRKERSLDRWWGTWGAWRPAAGSGSGGGWRTAGACWRPVAQGGEGDIGRRVEETVEHQASS